MVYILYLNASYVERLKKMKRAFEIEDSFESMESKRRRYEESILGKRFHGAEPSYAIVAKKQRNSNPNCVLGKRMVQFSTTQDAKRMKVHNIVHNPNPLQAALREAHATIRFQNEKITALEKQLRQLSYLIMMKDNAKMDNLQYKHLLECY